MSKYEHGRGGSNHWVRVSLGTTLVVLSTLPVYGIVAGENRGLAGRATVDIVETQADFLWSGALLLVLAGILAGLLLPPDFTTRSLHRAARGLRKLSPTGFALLLAGFGFLATLAFTTLVLEGNPNLIDAMAQLVHARYLAAGRWAGPVLEDPGFWFIQNTVLTDQGWVSQYPPGHVILLALGLKLGAVEAVGAVFVSVSAAFTYLSLRRLLPDDELVSRIAGLGVALSPFLISQAGSYMNHGSAAALSVLAVYFALRARDGRAAWGLALGAALGLLLTSRPLFALVIAFGVVMPVAMAGVSSDRIDLGGALRRVGLAVVGGAPFLAALMAYNAHFFGSPFDLGYVAAWGPEHGLGFHSDPWGNAYTPLAALGYTSADLTTLNLSLFETPLPVVTLAGLWLVLARRLGPGERIVAAWALLPVAANFFYWHHSYFMGPRMLAEATPAWTALVVLAVFGLLRRAPVSVRGRVRFGPRRAFVAVLLLAAAGAAWLAPLRLVQRGGDFHPGLRIEPPVPSGPALVFVHGGWSARVFGRLAKAGFTMAELETALRQHDLCDIERLLRTYEDGEIREIRSRLDLDPEPTTPGLVDIEVFPGNTITLARTRIASGALDLPAECHRQLQADRFGIFPVAPLLWRVDLPGLEANGTLYARDLGPERNAALRTRHPDRSHYLLARERPRGTLSLEPYEEGVARLWLSNR